MPTHIPIARLEGLDLARYFAFIGMAIVNFNIVVVDTAIQQPLVSSFIALFEGRAAATFVTLAGLGLGLAALRQTSIQGMRFVTIKRAAFLLMLGLLNTLVFDADILHYYGVYFLFGLLFLNLSNNRLFIAIALINILSICLIFVFDYEAGWQWENDSYTDFWTINGFIRNLFFNGWHPVIPWLSYLIFGIALSRYALDQRLVQHRLIIAGVIAIIASKGLSLWLRPILISIHPELDFLASTSSIPPMPLYILAGIGSASLVIGLCLLIHDKIAGMLLTQYFVIAGKQSLSLYLGHIFCGLWLMEIFGMLSNQPPLIALSCAAVYCGFATYFAFLYGKRFKRGPVEALMRKVTG